MYWPAEGSLDLQAGLETERLQQGQESAANGDHAFAMSLEKPIQDAIDQNSTLKVSSWAD